MSLHHISDQYRFKSDCAEARVTIKLHADTNTYILFNRRIIICIGPKCKHGLYLADEEV